MAQQGRDHDCAHEDAPGLELLGTDPVEGVLIGRCRACHHLWWLVDGTYYDPEEWGSLYEILEHAEVLRR